MGNQCGGVNWAIERLQGLLKIDWLQATAVSVIGLLRGGMPPEVVKEVVAAARGGAAVGAVLQAAICRDAAASAAEPDWLFLAATLLNVKGGCDIRWTPNHEALLQWALLKNDPMRIPVGACEPKAPDDERQVAGL
jgi:hypothetical protein